jgi:hypothetical protein
MGGVSMKIWSSLHVAILAIGVGTIITSTCHGGTIKVPLEYRAIPINPKLGVGLGSKHQRLTGNYFNTNYPGIVKPNNASARAVCGVLDYGGEKHLFMVDIDSTNAPFLNRVVYDANHNMDLNDDPPLETHLVKRHNKFYMLRALVSLDLNMAGQRKWDFVLESGGWGFSNPRSNNRKSSPGFFSAGALFGNAEFGDQRYEFQIQDRNVNGSFGDVTSALYDQKSDSFRIWQTDAKTLKPKERFAANSIPTHLVVGGKTFRLQVDPKGRSCSFSELKGDLARLTLPENVYSGQLESTNGTALFLKPARHVLFPSGAYRVGQFYLQKKDGKGTSWMLKTSSHHAETLTLAAGQETQLQITEPFSVTATVSDRKGAHYLCIWFKDSKGRAMDSDFIVRGIKKPPAPKAELIDKDGTVVKTIQLGYG